jgi:hypothetical protein
MSDIGMPGTRHTWRAHNVGRPLGCVTQKVVYTTVNTLKPKERERERERETKKWGGGVALGTNLTGGEEHKFRFAATKVPRQCPLVLLVKVGSVKVRRLEVE